MASAPAQRAVLADDHGEIERCHTTLRREWPTDADYRFVTIAEAQASLDGWVEHCKIHRPHRLKIASCPEHPTLTVVGDVVLR